MEKVQRRDTALIKGLENVPHSERLQELNLLKHKSGEGLT